MGTDIHCVVERFNGNSWEYVSPSEYPDDVEEELTWRSYLWFDVLGNGRGRYDIKPISTVEERYWGPDNDSDGYFDFGHGWATFDEIINYDWDQVIETNSAGMIWTVGDFLSGKLETLIPWFESFPDPGNMRLKFCFSN